MPCPHGMGRELITFYIALAFIPDCTHSFRLIPSPLRALYPSAAIPAHSPLRSTQAGVHPQFLRAASVVSTPRRGGAVTLRAATGEGGRGADLESPPPPKFDGVKVHSPNPMRWGASRLAQALPAAEAGGPPAILNNQERKGGCFHRFS